MPNIETLVEDIYGLFGKESIDLDRILVDAFGDNLVSLVHERFSREERAPTLRMSNIGKPDRQLWYEINRPDITEDLPPYTYIKFMYGDLIEQMLILLAKQSGHEVTNEQDTVSVDGIKGHIDCIIDGVLVDVKSASTFAFQKFSTGSLFEPGNDAFGYVGQLSGYAEAVGVERAAFLAIDKTTGKICLCFIPDEVRQMYKVRDRIEHVKAMVQGPIPDRCYPDVPDGASGNLKLDTGCSYCSRKLECWKDANDGAGLRTFYYSTGPRYLTKVVNLPRVAEHGKF